MFDNFLHWLESTSPAIAISESSWLFPGIESIHVLAIALVVGSITMVDLRLLDINLRDRPVGELMAEVLPWTWASFAVAVCSGALLFSSNASHYWGTLPFRAKMLLLAAGRNQYGGIPRHDLPNGRHLGQPICPAAGRKNLGRNFPGAMDWRGVLRTMDRIRLNDAAGADCRWTPPIDASWRGPNRRQAAAASWSPMWWS